MTGRSCFKFSGFLAPALLYSQAELIQPETSSLASLCERDILDQNRHPLNFVSCEFCYKQTDGVFQVLFSVFEVFKLFYASAS